MQAREFDWNLAIALIALAISVLSPAIVAVLNNCHERKMYSRRFYTEHRAQIIEEYIASVEQRIIFIDANPDSAGRVDYMSPHLCELHLYVDEKTMELIDDLEIDLRQGSTSCLHRFKAVAERLKENPPRTKN